MNLKQMQSTLEAVLFAVGEPIETQRLAQALEWDELILDQLLDRLQAKYDETDAGVCLLRLDQRVQLCSRLEYAEAIRKVLEVKRNAPLSQAAFEVLAIVAYNQPVTKSFIEQIRGVDCSAATVSAYGYRNKVCVALTRSESEAFLVSFHYQDLNPVGLRVAFDDSLVEKTMELQQARLLYLMSIPEKK